MILVETAHSNKVVVVGTSVTRKHESQLAIIVVFIKRNSITEG
jgi:hypothetical protein